MAALTVYEVERAFARLSPQDQLSLLERLVHRARLAGLGSDDSWETHLSSMAADPEIQRDLTRIRKEFSIAEADGLEGR